MCYRNTVIKTIASMGEKVKSETVRELQTEFSKINVFLLLQTKNTDGCQLHCISIAYVSKVISCQFQWPSLVKKTDCVLKRQWYLNTAGRLNVCFFSLVGFFLYQGSFIIMLVNFQSYFSVVL